MTGEGTLEFRLLGPLEARLDDQPLPLGGARQRGLLALLLLRANEVVARDRLIDELWRDHAPESAANALAALVARLRRVLPADVLVTRSGGYRRGSSPMRSTSIGSSVSSRREAAHSRPETPRRGRAAPPRSRCGGAPLADFTTSRSPSRRSGASRRPRRDREPDRRRPRARPARRPRRRAAVAPAGAPAPGAAARPADARPSTVGPPGRSAGGLPGRPGRAARRARHRPKPGAAGARAGDPAPGPRRSRADAGSASIPRRRPTTPCSVDGEVRTITISSPTSWAQLRLAERFAPDELALVGGA